MLVRSTNDLDFMKTLIKFFLQEMINALESKLNLITSK